MSLIGDLFEAAVLTFYDRKHYDRKGKQKRRPRSSRVPGYAREHGWPGAEVSADTVNDPRHPVERAFVEQMSSEDELTRVIRQRNDYFRVIARIEKERDALWVMHRIESSEHLNAQALLERRLMSTRRVAQRAILMLNKLRKDAGVDPIAGVGDLVPYEGEPVGTAERYSERMIALCDEFPQLLEGARPKMTLGVRERSGNVVDAETTEISEIADADGSSHD